MSPTLNSLRKQLRSKRRQLSIYEQNKAEQQVLVRLNHFPRFKAAKKIGLYLDAFGEVHTNKIIKLCFQRNKQVYLPMICNMNQNLIWIRVSATQYLNKRFSHHPLGMKEPMASRGRHVSHLDLLIMPLLACDNEGTRIGMGGGYYDRTLATATHSPYRLGLAHDFQYVDHPLSRQKWDQPLDGLLSPKKLYHFKR
ncbi:5-formyltetrahydrofolate cyclo-ligase [Acinetobacter sp. ANC 3929]|uniref:5-formyltetrahydrofolate cyclo-ligase n=1 Tax=unclassified Acinetobacter TaxID=196816 RepID=UPI0002CE853E|nr:MULTISPECIES: 5-formyltetrahydrofolate cyclo-ligase [unclassified Acinetobacter]ENW78791.1 5-formyltetrahydrofolate cyclo-ligase [Acinetobacter sp. ANC 3929]MCH7351460.1 5-formyltetrahydrofolate cyclo-ligase [Acinetobacter sp. NIPH 2023]MCH7355838.1 5-formyltetrahydrofolate cyclo-ligase [Acinetobacter sp. NIPH 1958]MCH7359137.1 5-formyltetrahydrofolate cyclo-ligase [Acinetobacter sp. NIPH 2024]